MEKQLFMQACRDRPGRMEKALRTLYADYGGALLRDGVLALGDIEHARDLLQDTMLKAWRGCASFRGDSELFPWLKRIFRNHLIDMLRRRQDETPLSSDRTDGELDADMEAALRAWRSPVDPTPEEALWAQQLEVCFRACAARFARDHPLCATVVRWVIEDGYGPAEIAELLNVNRAPGATREYISQCRIKARIYFADWYAMTLNGSNGSGQKP